MKRGLIPMPKIIDQSYEILRLNPGADLDLIAQAGRICYKSEKIDESDESKMTFVKRLIERGHETPLEHGIMTVKFITNRGVTHELVRHRLASFNQESTRYCNYANDKFNNELTFIKNSAFDVDMKYLAWLACKKMEESSYLKMIEHDYKPEEARGVLSNDLKTEIIVTANYREWRHIFKLRCDKHAHYQIRELLTPLLKELCVDRIPSLNLSWAFGDIWEEINSDN